MAKQPIGMRHTNMAHTEANQFQTDEHLTQEHIAEIAVRDGSGLSVDDVGSTTTPDYVIFKLVNTKRKGGVRIPNIDDVINPETKNVERMRLLVGESRIWQKDQKDIPKDYIDKNSRSLAFPRGMKVLRIPKWDKAALDFARLTRHNISGVNGIPGTSFSFFEYNPQKQAEEALANELLELEMGILASKLDMPTVKKLVSFLKIRIHDDTGELKGDAALQKELMLYAKRFPKDFKNLVDNKSKEVEVSFLVKKAVNANLIDISTKPGRAFWANGGGLIGVIPNNREVKEYLTELALTNSEDGRSFQDKLLEVMK